MIKSFLREFGSGGSEVYGMKTDYENGDRNNEFDNGVDQAQEGLNEMILNFRAKLQSSDLEDQNDLDVLHQMIAEVAETDFEQAETLKQEMMDRKIE